MPGGAKSLQPREAASGKKFLDLTTFHTWLCSFQNQRNRTLGPLGCPNLMSNLLWSLPCTETVKTLLGLHFTQPPLPFPIFKLTQLDNKAFSTIYSSFQTLPSLSSTRTYILILIISLYFDISLFIFVVLSSFSNRFFRKGSWKQYSLSLCMLITIYALCIWKSVFTDIKFLVIIFFLWVS